MLVDALKLLREEVEWRDPQWSSLVSGWKGGGDWGKDDPCGECAFACVHMNFGSVNISLQECSKA